MKKLIKKLSPIIMALVAISAISASNLVTYAAVNNDINYTFTIKAKGGINKYSEKEFRNTYNNNNAWKVNLRASGEGEKTCTNFRLCLPDNTGASGWHKVQQGTGAHYYAGYDSADHTHVYLQGQNNNKNTKSYTVSGYWDEETGKSPE